MPRVTARIVEDLYLNPGGAGLAWPHEGVCALGEDEALEQGIRCGVDGGSYQLVND